MFKSVHFSCCNTMSVITTVADLISCKTQKRLLLDVDKLLGISLRQSRTVLGPVTQRYRAVSAEESESEHKLTTSTIPGLRALHGQQVTQWTKVDL